MARTYFANDIRALISAQVSRARTAGVSVFHPDVYDLLVQAHDLQDAHELGIPPLEHLNDFVRAPK